MAEISFKDWVMDSEQEAEEGMDLDENIELETKIDEEKKQHCQKKEYNTNEGKPTETATHKKN